MPSSLENRFPAHWRGAGVAYTTQPKTFCCGLLFVLTTTTCGLLPFPGPLSVFLSEMLLILALPTRLSPCFPKMVLTSHSTSFQSLLRGLTWWHTWNSNRCSNALIPPGAALFLSTLLLSTWHNTYYFIHVSFLFSYTPKNPACHGVFNIQRSACIIGWLNKITQCCYRLQSLLYILVCA